MVIVVAFLSEDPEFDVIVVHENNSSVLPGAHSPSMKVSQLSLEVFFPPFID